MTAIEEPVALAEEQLRQAMLASDVGALDRLIAGNLVFTTHQGRVFTKETDLEAHRSGVLKLTSLEPSEQLLQVDGHMAIASVRMKLSGIYGGQPFAADLRYTRVWRKTKDDRWQVIAGHSSAVQP